MKRWLAIAGGALGVGLIGYAVFGAESDEERIRARLIELEDAVRVEGQVNPLVRTSQVNKAFKEIFTEHARITFSQDAKELYPQVINIRSGRAELSKAASQGTAFLQRFDVDFGSIEIQLTGDSGAEVDTIAAINALDKGARGNTEKRDVSFVFFKDDEWRIDSIAVGDVAE